MVTLSLKKLLENGIELIAKDEVFAKVVNWNKYFISNHGRLIHKNCKGKYRIVNPSITSGGYLTYTLSKPARTYNGKKVRDANGNIKTQQKCNSAQNMVAKMFVYNPYPRMQYAIEDLQAHHKDKNRQNNYYKNLMWLSTEDHGFVHRIKRIAIYNSETCKYRCYNDIESILKKIRMNIFEFRETIKQMDRENMTVKDGQWIVYLINGVYVAIEYYVKK